VVVVVRPVCHTTQQPLTVQPQGLAAAAAGAAPAGQITAYKVCSGGSRVMGLVAVDDVVNDVEDDDDEGPRVTWTTSSTEVAPEPDVLFATRARAEAGRAAARQRAQAAGRPLDICIEEVSLRASEGLLALPDFNQHSPLLDPQVRALWTPLVAVPCM
jgi:hypothetical protein